MVGDYKKSNSGKPAWPHIDPCLVFDGKQWLKAFAKANEEGEVYYEGKRIYVYVRRLVEGKRHKKLSWCLELYAEECIEWTEEE